MPASGGGVFSELDLAFWVQFAGMWRRLAEMPNNTRRSEYLQKARTCLLRAEAVREVLSQRNAGNSNPEAFSN